MKRGIRDTLDECLALLQSEQITLDECLTRYPDQAAELRPLLEVALAIRRQSPPVPSSVAREAGKQRMLHSLAEKERQKQPSSPTAQRIPSWRWKRAPTLHLALAATGVLVLLVVAGVLLQSWSGTVVLQTAVLTDARGVVQVLSPEGDGWQPVMAGKVVAAQDRIRTGESSAVTLTFFDGSRSYLEAETELTVSLLSSRRNGNRRIIILHQSTGQTHNHVERQLDAASRFEVETDTTVAVVRGTVFTVVVEENGTTDVMVTEGQVEVMAQETTVVVQAGHGTKVLPEQPPATVHPLPNVAEPTVVTPALYTSTPSESPALTNTSQPASQNRTPQSSQPTAAPESRDPTTTPHPPTHTLTPRSVSPTETRTGQPSDRTPTPRSARSTKTPQIPTPSPTGRHGIPTETRTPQPSHRTPTPRGSAPTNTPQVPGQTTTPQPSGPTKTPQGSTPTKISQPRNSTATPQSSAGPTRTPRSPGSATTTPSMSGQTQTPGPPKMP